MTTRRSFSLRNQLRCGNTKARAKWGSGRNNRHRPGREEGHTVATEMEIETYDVKWRRTRRVQVDIRGGRRDRSWHYAKVAASGPGAV